MKKAAKEDSSIKPFIEQANTAVDAAIKEARNHYSRQLGLYWPNYLESERAANQARFQRMDQKFHRWGKERHVRALYRVQSNEDRSPRWIALEVTMHRMLPANGIIKWAHLQTAKILGRNR